MWTWFEVAERDLKEEEERKRKKELDELPVHKCERTNVGYQVYMWACRVCGEDMEGPESVMDRSKV